MKTGRLSWQALGSVLHDVMRHSCFIMWHEGKPLNCVISSQTRTYRGKITRIHLLFRSCNLLLRQYSAPSPNCVIPHVNTHIHYILYTAEMRSFFSLIFSVSLVFSELSWDGLSHTHTHTHKTNQEFQPTFSFYLWRVILEFKMHIKLSLTL